jgi:hypothetical protein
MKKVILIQHAHLYFIYHNLPCTTILNFKHGLDSLDNVDIEPQAKFQNFIQEQPLHMVIALDCHYRIGQGGVTFTLIKLRCSYWIVGG